MITIGAFEPINSVNVVFRCAYTNRVLINEPLLYPPSIGQAMQIEDQRYRVAHVIWGREYRPVNVVDPGGGIYAEAREVWYCEVLLSPQVGQDSRPKGEPPLQVETVITPEGASAPGTLEEPGQS